MNDLSFDFSDFTSFVSISHAEDLDGLASQVLVQQCMARQGIKARASCRVRYDGIKEQLTAIIAQALDRTAIFITDINLNHQYQDDVLALARSGNGNHVFYFDHHQYTWERQHELNAEERVTCIAARDDVCATSLVQQHLLPDDAHARYLAREACLSDLHDEKRNSRSILLSRVISMKTAADLHHPDLPRIMDVISKPGFYEDQWLAREMTIHEKMHKEALETAMSMAQVHAIKGIRIAWARSDLIGPGDLMRELVKHHDPDLALGFNSNGKAAIASLNPRISAVHVSEIWNGGGHEDRAAFYWNKFKATLEQFIADELVPKIDESLKNR